MGRGTFPGFAPVVRLPPKIVTCFAPRCLPSSDAKLLNPRSPIEPAPGPSMCIPRSISVSPSIVIPAMTRSSPFAVVAANSTISPSVSTIRMIGLLIGSTPDSTATPDAGGSTTVAELVPLLILDQFTADVKCPVVAHFDSIRADRFCSVSIAMAQSWPKLSDNLPSVDRQGPLF